MGNKIIFDNEKNFNSMKFTTRKMTGTGTSTTATTSTTTTTTFVIVAEEGTARRYRYTFSFFYEFITKPVRTYETGRLPFYFFVYL